jgi:DNA repair exonuclease SbcCD ATPase subunit
MVEYRRILDQKYGQRELLINQKTKVLEDKNNNEVLLEQSLKAREVVQIVAEETQKNLEFQVSTLVSSALASVFPEPYEFNLQFVQRRNKTEADLIFTKGKNTTDDLIETAGGGAEDVASFALRIALWSIKQTRPIMIIDEAFRFLSLDLQEKASDMIKEISTRLGIQVIMVSHLPGMIRAADKVIEIEYKNGESHVKTQS